MQKIKLLFLISQLLFSCLLSANEHQSVAISDLWISEAPPTVSVLAAYAKIENLSDKPKVLTSVTSPYFSKIELHLSEVVNDVAKMIKQESISIPANSHLELSPGAYHLMLFNPKTAIKAGDKQTIHFNFEDKTSISIEATVEKRNNTSHHHHHHHH